MQGNWEHFKERWNRAKDLSIREDAVIAVIATVIGYAFLDKEEAWVATKAIAIGLVAGGLWQALKFAWKFFWTVPHEIAIERDKAVVLREAMPRLVCKGMSFHDQPLVAITEGLAGSPPVPAPMSRIIGTPTFYHMRIANEPLGGKTAGKVAGRVRIFPEDGGEVKPDRLHRWESAPGPLEVGKAADEHQERDIAANGIEHTLDIAMKYDDEDHFYTVTNDTILRGTPGWRDPWFEYPPGAYIATVELAGTNVVSTLSCRIVNRGKGQKLAVTPLTTQQVP
jgi:hypothetical protein